MRTVVAEYVCERCTLVYNWQEAERMHGACENCSNPHLTVKREATPKEVGEITTIKQLESLKQRYWRPVMARKVGLLVHFGDCETHRALIEGQWTAPCTCGLNHDLRYLAGTRIATKLNPNYWEEYDKQERGIIHPPATEEEKAACDKLLKEHFVIIEETLEEKRDQDEYEWSLIAKVFGSDYVEYMRTNNISPQSPELSFNNEIR